MTALLIAAFCLWWLFWTVSEMVQWHENNSVRVSDVLAILFLAWLVVPLMVLTDLIIAWRMS